MRTLSQIINVSTKSSHNCPYKREAEENLTQTEEEKSV